MDKLTALLEWNIAGWIDDGLGRKATEDGRDSPGAVLQATGQPEHGHSAGRGRRTTRGMHPHPQGN